MTKTAPGSLAGRAGLFAAALLASSAALAVNDLPGGPAVNQMGYARPATQIAAQMDWLHTMMMVICSAIFGNGLVLTHW